MLISIERLRPDSTPVRQRLWQADDDALRISMAELGQLDPLLVLRLGDDFDDAAEYEVKDGNRRLAAARALGWLAMEVAELPRRTAQFAQAAATAANMVRAPLAALDQWRAVVALQDRGYTLAAAAACLGLSDRQAAKLDRLGRLHPDVLKLIDETGELPSDHQLRIIASAPPELQKQAAAAKGAAGGTGDNRWVNWQAIVEACYRRRIPRTAAIFDTAAAGVAFTQDFFAPEGSDEEWTTIDVAGFLAAQRAALEAQAAASKGRLVLAEENPRDPGTPTLPKGWRASRGKPDKPTRRETVYACVSARTGAVVRITAIDEVAEKAREKAAKDKAKAEAKAAPIRSAIGTVATPLTPTPDADDDDDGADPDDDDEEEEDDAPRPTPPAPQPKAPMTKAGQVLLAKAKTEALRARLRDRTQPISNDILVPLLILALHASNVEIRGYDQEGAWGRDRGQDLVRRLITPDGHLQFDGAELPHIAGEALARVLHMSSPDSSTYVNPGSGDIAEWIGAAIDAQARMPRLDTAELLATLSADKLKNAAALANMKFTTATAAKRDLVGKLPDWRPDYTHFGAPGPKPAKEAA